MRIIAAVIVTALVAAFAAPGPALAAPNWPSFRGPGEPGHVDSSNLPVEWSESKNVTWKTEVKGKAWSSPVVYGDQIWLTNSYDDGVRLEAICIDKNSGKVIKTLRLHSNPAPQYCHPFNSYASPSPTIEEGRVYVTFGAPYTACIDTKTFEVLWSRTDIKCNHFRGAGSSPVIYGDLLLMHFDGSDYQFATALNKHTGETVWRTDRSVDFKDLDPKTGKPDREGDWRKAYSTPVVHDFGDGPVMISLASKALYGYDPKTGKELWRFEWDKAHSGSNKPVVGHGMIYFCTGSGGELWAVKPGAKGQSGVLNDSNVVWKFTQKVAMKPSLLLVDDLLYMVNDAGIASCFEAQTGKEVWQARLKGRARSAGEYSASPIYADGKIYFFDQEGRTTVIEHGREFKVLATNDLGEGSENGFMASPAVTDDALILRTKTHLYRIEK